MSFFISSESCLFMRISAQENCHLDFPLHHVMTSPLRNLGLWSHAHIMQVPPQNGHHIHNFLLRPSTHFLMSESSLGQSLFIICLKGTAWPQVCSQVINWIWILDIHMDKDKESAVYRLGKELWGYVTPGLSQEV